MSKQRWNSTAFLFWLFCACVGGLIGGWHGALIGFTIGLGLSLFAQIFL